MRPAKVESGKGKVESKLKVGIRAFYLLSTFHLLLCTCAYAQSPPLLGRMEASVGPIWLGAIPFGSADATLTAPGGDRFRLFSTSSELVRATGLELRLSHRLMRLVHAEASASYARPQLSTTVGSDAENGPSITAAETITRVTIVGAGLIELPFVPAGPRIHPFVMAGAGYLRQLHEGNTLVQTGRTYHVGGGAKLVLLSRDERHWLKQVGARVDVRAEVRSGGIALDGRAHVSPAVTAGIFGRFW